MDLGSFARLVPEARLLAGDKLQGKCIVPGHPDDDAELSLMARQDGDQILVGCFGGLGHTTAQILTALKLTADDLKVTPKEEPRRPRTQTPPPRGQGGAQNGFDRRLPPQNLEAEQSVLGAVLLENEALAAARQVLATRDFYRESHRFLFEAMCDLVDRGEPVDAITLKNHLKGHNLLEKTGGAAYIAELASVVPTASNVRYYAVMVQDAAVKRRIARDAGELIEMAHNGVQAESLIGEWQRRVTVFDRGMMAPPEIPWEELDEATAVNDAYLQRQPVIDKLCYATAVSMVTGGKHAGKSTLARWMAICVAKGIPFLGRDVMQGPVFYVASEDEEMAARLELIRLGWRPDDHLRFFGKSKIRSDDFDFLGMLTKEIKRHRAVLVVVDMLFDFIHVEDEMSYAGTRRAVGAIQDVASDSGAHLCVLHHAPKNANIGDATIAALGSQGLAARVSPIILVRRFGQGVHSISSTAVRDPRGEAVAESRLIRREDGSVHLGGAFKNYMLAEVYAERVYDLLAEEPGSEMTATDIAANLELSYQVARSCVWFLFSNNRIGRTGAGKKGRPFRYYVPLTDISQTTENSEDEKVYSPRTSTQSESHEDLEQQGRFGYKENSSSDDLDEYGISRSK